LTWWPEQPNQEKKESRPDCKALHHWHDISHWNLSTPKFFVFMVANTQSARLVKRTSNTRAVEKRSLWWKMERFPLSLVCVW
jgi:hypothetical protein